MGQTVILRRTVGSDVAEVPLHGRALLEHPLFNKGTAFTQSEREELGLLGLLPPREETLADQVIRAHHNYQRKTTDLERHIYLRALQDTNETLFYALLLEHLTEMLPIIYTPTVGQACERFSEIYRRPRGVFIAWPQRDRIEEMLRNAYVPKVEVIVATDGERILGLGDQGAGGMGIPIGKLSLYTACGGIDPATTLPVFLDVGTNNKNLLADPLYIGWRHERITGDEYDAFVEQFVAAVRKLYPDALLQWEDFAQPHAGPILRRYKDQLCTFNDDIQGTAAVTFGTLLAAVKVAGSKLADQRVVIMGAGSAGVGIAEQIAQGMVREGLSEADARARFWLVDRPGLLHQGLSLQAFQRPFARDPEELDDWPGREGDSFPLRATVEHVKPTVLIGVTGVPGLFPEPVIREMARHVPRPIVFPLSNPTRCCEAAPADVLSWTEGRALVATGSPFEPVDYGGRRYHIAQCNNAYVFPGLGLGVLAVGATRVTDGMFMAAADALCRASPALLNEQHALLPPLAEIRGVARRIALAVGREAMAAQVAPTISDEELEKRIAARFWQPRYRATKFSAA